ncbi:MAG: hypothetical protein OXC60_00415 [Litoreibacter sp.]|nr:hypothetical protein [Litoreibacter sp.]
MKPLFLGLALSLATMAGSATAEVKVMVDGAEVPLSTLMENCKSIKGDPEAQVACFSSLSKMLEEQASGAQDGEATITQNLESLQSLAQYKDEGSGLVIAADGCMLNVTYYDNYFHISRRNVSTIDIISVEFNAAQLQFDQASHAQSSQAPFSKGVMDIGARAKMRGGLELDSNMQNFPSKSARMPMADYVNEVVAQLPDREDQVFDFVMVHPANAGKASEIWSAFSQLVTTCREIKGPKKVS